MENHIQATLERYIDFSDVEEHNSMCPPSGLYYPRLDTHDVPAYIHVQGDIMRWI